MAAPRPIASRRVLFIPGFDPNPPRAHRERYRAEGVKQAAICGYALSLSADPASDPAAWQVDARFGAHSTATRIEVLTWSDLVREAMSAGLAASYRALFRTVWVYVRSGALFRLMGLRKGPVIAAFYPVVALLVQALLAMAAGGIAGGIWTWGLGWMLGAVESGRPFQDPSPVSTFGALVVGCAVAIAVLRWFKRHDGRLLVHYLMQDYAYSAGLDGAYPAELSIRMNAFTDRLVEAAQGPADEILLIGHSSGAYLAVTVLADALRRGALPEGRRIAFLTLGQVVPMVSVLPGADRLRSDLAFLAASDRITWVDVTAPGDGCAFALCDPVAVSGAAPAGKRWPLVISAAFTQTLSPETWARLRWRFFRLHFQYLCAFDRPGDYDFFAITAGPVALSDRFAARDPSPSRIETPMRARAEA